MGTNNRFLLLILSSFAENALFPNKEESPLPNFLLNRKNLYDHRNKDDLDLVKFYKSLKNEVNIKKFSFLTY